MNRRVRRVARRRLAACAGARRVQQLDAQRRRNRRAGTVAIGRTTSRALRTAGRGFGRGRLRPRHVGAPCPGRRDGRGHPGPHRRIPSLKLLATDIALGQQGQIGRMSGWLDEWGLDQTSTATPMALDPRRQPAVRLGRHERHGRDAMGSDDGRHDGAGADGRMPGMATRPQVTALGTLPIDEAEISFLRLMIAHHLAGVDMAQAALARTEPPRRGPAGHQHRQRPAGRDRRDDRHVGEARRHAVAFARTVRRCQVRLEVPDGRDNTTTTDRRTDGDRGRTPRSSKPNCSSRRSRSTACAASTDPIDPDRRTACSTRRSSCTRRSRCGPSRSARSPTTTATAGWCS